MRSFNSVHMHTMVIEMPRGDGTGPNGTLINCTDPTTGVRRPIANNRNIGNNRNYIPANTPRSSQGVAPYNPNITSRNPVVGRGRGGGRGRRGRGFHGGRR